MGKHIETEGGDVFSAYKALKWPSCKMGLFSSFVLTD